MAQWIGQFTSNTHKTKVEDCEESLRHAVAVFTECTDNDKRPEKLKSVQKLAEKLFVARTKLLRARIYDAEPVLDGEKRETKKLLNRLHEQLDSTEMAGTEGILKEFGINNAPIPDIHEN